MTAELDELLAAAKVMFMTNTAEEAGRLHKAITAFEAARAKQHAPDPYVWNNAGLRMSVDDESIDTSKWGRIAE